MKVIPIRRKNQNRLPLRREIAAAFHVSERKKMRSDANINSVPRKSSVHLPIFLLSSGIYKDYFSDLIMFI
jgi:hypothetical protein